MQASNSSTVTGGDSNRTYMSSEESLKSPTRPVRHRVRTISETCFRNGTREISSTRRFMGDDIDRFLESRNMLKKAMPPDGNSLFRAVVERLMGWQSPEDFIKLRHMCDEEIEHRVRLNKIGVNSDFMVPLQTTNVVSVLAQMLRIRIIIYKGVGMEPEIVPAYDDYEGELIEVHLCETERDYYELVYPKEKQVNLAVSQSVIYEMLYTKILKMDKKKIVDAIEHVRLDSELPGTPRTPSSSGSGSGSSSDRFSFGSPQKAERLYSPPMPFSAVKSLDPSMYRNISFDHHERKRKISQSLDRKDPGLLNSQAVRFPPGSTCLSRDGGMIKEVVVIGNAGVDQNQRLVEFPPRGDRRIIAVSDLRPVQQPAKIITTNTGSAVPSLLSIQIPAHYTGQPLQQHYSPPQIYPTPGVSPALDSPPRQGPILMGYAPNVKYVIPPSHVQMSVLQAANGTPLATIYQPMPPGFPQPRTFTQTPPHIQTQFLSPTQQMTKTNEKTPEASKAEMKGYEQSLISGMNNMWHKQDQNTPPKQSPAPIYQAVPYGIPMNAVYQPMAYHPQCGYPGVMPMYAQPPPQMPYQYYNSTETNRSQPPPQWAFSTNTTVSAGSLDNTGCFVNDDKKDTSSDANNNAVREAMNGNNFEKESVVSTSELVIVKKAEDGKRRKQVVKMEIKNGTSFFSCLSEEELEDEANA